jgi:hypothetical protein
MFTPDPTLDEIGVETFAVRLGRPDSLRSLEA